MSASGPARILAFGEAALVVEFGNAIDPELNRTVRALDAELARQPFPGFIESVPTYRSLLVQFDPRTVSPEEARAHLSALAARASAERLGPPARKEVPTVYDGEDLEEVARRHGLTPRQVVELHSKTTYTVYMLGFSPGFAYMGLLPEAIATPRRATPRTRVPAGTVAIAGRQTGVYPAPTPGGWHLIGRSCLPWFDPNANPPTYFVPGDEVRFVPVEELAAPELPRSAEGPARGAATVEVLEGGLLTTVQDVGRCGYQRYGVPVAGAVDEPALRAGNLLVGNEPGAAALECTVAGPALRFLRTTVAAVTGADLGALLERDDLGAWPVPLGWSFLARRGNVLRFTGRRAGARAYVALAGGIDVPPVLGSRSTYLPAGLGGYRGRAVQSGDRIHTLEPGRAAAPGRRAASLQPPPAGAATVRVLLGPQEDYFTEKARETLLSAEYRLADSSDRMGCRLEGPVLEHRAEKEIVSDGMLLGGIQVPPDGRPIVMLADRATTGGYPKIATVIRADVALLGQLLPGERVRFQGTSVEEAIRALI